MISVIIPFYCGNKFLKQIDNMISNNSRLLKNKTEIELVIVNDSPWCDVDTKQLRQEGYFLNIIENKENLGIHGSRIHGLQEAKGEYVMMLDQDDLIESSCLVQLYTHINDSDVIVSNGYKLHGKEKKKIYGNYKRQKKVKKLFYYLYLENRILSPGQCLIKKESIPEKWCNIAMKVNGADDMLLWIMMLRNGKKFSLHPECLYTHVFTGENVSGDDSKMAKSTYEMLDILSTEKILGLWQQHILKRKINNDINYINVGKDLYVDYRFIEWMRKILKRSR